MSQNRETRSTLKDFLSRAPGSTADTISLSPNPNDTSPYNMINEGDDLGIDPNTGQQLIGLTSAFVAYLTQQNVFPLLDTQEDAASPNRGNPIPLAQDQGATRVFARAGTTLGQVMSQTSNSGLQDDSNYPIKSYLDKTGADSSKTGHTLLSGVRGRTVDQTGNLDITTSVDLDTASGKMQVGTVETVATQNKNSPQEVAVNRLGTIDEVDGFDLQSLQGNFGNYQKNDSSTTKQIPYDRLKNVGQWLLESAAGYTTSDLGETQESVLDNMIANSGKINTTISELSSKIDTIGGDITRDKVRPTNANTVPKGASGESLRSGKGDYRELNDDADYTQPSTVTYTPAAPASDFVDQKKIAIAQARACYSITKLAEKLANQYNTLVKDITPDKPNTQPNTLKSLGPYYMGSSLYGRVNAMHRMIMNLCFVPTKNSYIDAVNAGMQLMLGTSPDTQGDQTKFGVALSSPVFWNSVAESALKILEKQYLPVNDPTQIGQYYRELGNSKAVKLMNTFATIGDIALQVTGKNLDAENLRSDINAARGLDNIDNIPSTAGTRIAKSRDINGRSSLSMAWRGNSVPGLYMLPDDPVRASLLMGNIISGPSPMRGLLASSAVDKTYTDPTLKGAKARIPGEFVKIIEDRLDSEYVPFYFHDLRTNEIIAFHAFLETLNESYTVNYNTFKTYGRADPIRTYGDTARTISVTFNVVATSREDFDEMWFKINKLITFVYPKYTSGQRVLADNDVTFEQPFSQVVGASPLMRLRVGDVIKSNYSRFNLARIFGIGSEGTDVSNFKGNNATALSNAVDYVGDLNEKITSAASMKIFYALFGTPTKSISTGLLATDNTGLSKIIQNPVTVDLASDILVNGFVNPLGYALITSTKRAPDDLLFGASLPGYVLPGGVGTHYLKARERPYDVIDENQNIVGSVRIRRPIKVAVTSTTVPRYVDREDQDSTSGNFINSIKRTGTYREETRYKVKIVEVSNIVDYLFEDNTLGSIDYIIATHDDIIPNLGTIFAPAAAFINPVSTVTDIIESGVDSLASAVNLNVGSLLDNAANSGTKGFMSPSNNAIVRSFENNRGRGLAGTIKSLSFTWIDFPWEIDWGARAPIGAKVTLSFEPIHDISPGLDASGFMRAPTYNVGAINNALAGDPYDDDGDLSRSRFAQEGASNATKR